MRDLHKFTALEWLQLLPVKYALRQMRNDVWLAIYKKIRPKNLSSFLRETELLKGQNISLVIAFEQPWALDWQLRMAQRNLLDNQAILVFDNSRRDAARLEIERVCRDRGAYYFALPMNFTRHVNRSHGMAMTWVFHNVVRAIQPRMFAFLDHDLIPVEKVSLAERLSNQPFYGDLRINPWSWNLWAGYCLYNFQSVANLPLNFLYDFSQKLDTGGRNWCCLYQNHEWQQLAYAKSTSVLVKAPDIATPRAVQMVDNSWLHIGSISYNDNLRSKLDFFKNLALTLDQGVSWLSLVELSQPQEGLHGSAAG